VEKIFFYDLETTDVKKSTLGIHQISGAIMIEGEVKETFNFKVCPHEGFSYTEEALAIGKVTLESLQSHPKEPEIYQQIVAILSKYVDKYDKQDKFHLAGYNISSFDNEIFRGFFKRNNDNYFGSWFWADCIDLYPILSFRLRKKRYQLVDFKLQTIAAILGIIVEEENLHNASYDVDLCVKIFNIITEMNI